MATSEPSSRQRGTLCDLGRAGTPSPILHHYGSEWSFSRCWGTGFVITGDTAAAGTAHHKGETMERPEYERRLEEHREERGAPAGAAGSLSADTIVLDIVEADREPFEQERYGPEATATEPTATERPG